MFEPKDSPYTSNATERKILDLAKRMKMGQRKAERFNKKRQRDLEEVV